VQAASLDLLECLMHSAKSVLPAIMRMAAAVLVASRPIWQKVVEQYLGKRRHYESIHNSSSYGIQAQKVK
jgi:hypothetical protein